MHIEYFEFNREILISFLGKLLEAFFLFCENLVRLVVNETKLFTD